MFKGIILILLVLASANTYASFLKVTANGVIDKDSITLITPGTLCCTVDEINIDFEFSTVINLDSFSIFKGSDGRSYQYFDYESELTINGIAAPRALIHPDPRSTGIAFAHIISPERTVGGSGQPYSSIQLSAGLTFEKDNRFTVMDNLFLRELTLFTNIFDVNPIIGEPENLQSFLDELTQGSRGLRRNSFGSIALGDESNMSDNVEVVARFNYQINFQQISARVPESQSILLFGIGALLLATRRRLTRQFN